MLFRTYYTYTLLVCEWQNKIVFDLFEPKYVRLALGRTMEVIQRHQNVQGTEVEEK